MEGASLQSWAVVPTLLTVMEQKRMSLSQQHQNAVHTRGAGSRNDKPFTHKHATSRKIKVTGTSLAHAVVLSMNMIIGAPHYVILHLCGLGLA